MDATLSMEDGIYYLDWGGNSLGSRPVLVANDLPFGCWCLIEVLLDIFRHLPQKPSSIQCGPTEKTRKQLLEAFTHWSIEIRSKSFTEKLNNSLIFDGHSLPVEVGTQLGISMRNCFVTNIKDEC